MLETGERYENIDKTTWKAKHDHACVWGTANGNPHIIKAGDTYVRVFYKVEDGERQCDHICLVCWCGAFGGEDSNG
jgi:hypothetical protein